MKKKDVEFDYFEAWCYEDDENGEKKISNKFQLETIFQAAQKRSAQEITYPYRGEKARIQKVVYDTTNKVWEIQLLRLREIAPPGLAKDDGTYEIFLLEDGEYIGESVSMLYDPEFMVLCIQRNYNAIPPSGVEEYLNKTIDFNPIICLRPKLLSSKNITKLSNSKIFRKISLAIATDDFIIDDRKQGLNKLLGNILKYDGSIVHIDISVGNSKKDKSLSPGLAYDTIQNLYNDSATTKLKANIRDINDTKVEKVDLFDDRMKDIDGFEVNRENPLTHERVYPNLRFKFLSRRNKGDFKK